MTENYTFRGYLLIPAAAQFNAHAEIKLLWADRLTNDKQTVDVLQVNAEKIADIPVALAAEQSLLKNELQKSGDEKHTASLQQQLDFVDTLKEMFDKSVYHKTAPQNLLDAVDPRHKLKAAEVVFLHGISGMNK